MTLAVRASAHARFLPPRAAHTPMAEPDQAIWAEMLAHLRANHPGVCRQWFDDIRPAWVGSGAIDLVIADDLQRRYLERECAAAFNDAACAATGHLLAVRFCSPEEGEKRAAEHRARAESRRSRRTVAPAAPVAVNPAGAGESRNGTPPPAGTSRVVREPIAPRSSDELALNPDCNFDNFVVGPNNRLAHAAATAASAAPGAAYNPLFVYGGVGLGKTHLLQAICQRVRTDQPDATILFISCEGFTTRFLEAVQAGEMADFRHRFRDVDLLVIDDIHFLAKRDQTQEEFFHTFNSLYQARRQIILSSDAAPDEIPDLEERLVSRFKWGLVACIEAPPYDTRVSIVKNKAQQRGVALPDEVACFIAARIDTNIRELEGALTRVQMQAIVNECAITLPVAEEALGPAENKAGAPRMTIEHIVEAVTDYFDVPLSHLQSKKRQRSIALPRQVCMYLAREHTRYSLEEIGGYFGGRDHSTVLHSVRTIAENRKSDADLEDAIRAVQSRLSAVAAGRDA
jgi:chromosomal replication initiator protein